MSVHLDDSLTDLLSDNSHENDAFFQGSLHTLKRDTKTSNVSSAKSKSSKGSDNLFGITEESLEQDMSRNKPTASSTPLISNDDDVVATDDEDLGFDPKKPKATPSKFGLFDDILAGTLNDAKRSAPTPATRRSAANREERRPAISRQSTDTTTDNSNIQRPKTSTGRRGSSLSNVMNPDPLGLFSQPAKEQTQLITKKRGTTADWLGLNTTETDEDQETPRPQYTAERRIESPVKTPRVNNATVMQPNLKPHLGYDILKLNETIEPHEQIDPKIASQDESHNVAAFAAVSALTAQNVLQLNAMNLETRNAFALLQQQEPQLTLAAQMKQQERALLDMQRKQDALLQQQERQFQSLLQQQLQRQQHLEENIKLQQQRINAHIQLMLTQPAYALEALPAEQPMRATDISTDEQQATVVAFTAPSERSEHATTTQAALDLIQVETDIRRLELEKLRLEELVANMKSKYEREIDMIDATHKKQLEVLDEHTAALEMRLRVEITEITDHYNRKLTALEDEHQKKKGNYDSEIATLRHNHEDEVRRIRKTHEEDLEMLREEHRRMLETVQRSKMLEFAIVQDNNNYLDTLKAASANLTEATSELQDIREHLQSKLELANKEKQQELEARERRLVDKERRLQISEETTEQEKTHLMKLVSTLEQQLSSLSKESSEENWQLRMKLSALEADKAAFEREREYVREQMQRDEKRLEDLKERQVSELQRMNAELQEERRMLQVEKIKFETEQKLRSSGINLERERCEMETAMKCAQDATRQADTERQRYYALQRELEQRKRELIDAESEQRAKQEKLSGELKACLAAEQQAQDATKRAQLIEQNFQEKLHALQMRSRELAEKEAFLAEERKLLAQQRIAIKETQSRVAAAHRVADVDGGDYGDLKKVTQTLQVAEEFQKGQETRASLNLVDRLLDDNIAESMQRMRIKTPPGKATITTTWADGTTKRLKFSNLDIWPPVGLDDDSKTLVLNRNFKALELGLQGREGTTEL